MRWEWGRIVSTVRGRLILMGVCKNQMVGGCIAGVRRGVQGARHGMHRRCYHIRGVIDALVHCVLARALRIQIDLCLSLFFLV